MSDGSSGEPQQIKRLHYLRRVAFNTAANLSASLTKSSRRPVAIEIDPTALDELNSEYWRLVAEFKAANAFRDGERINPAKRAALMAYCIFAADRCLLIEPEEKLHQNHRDIFNLLFLKAVIEDFLFVNPKMITPGHSHDLLAAIMANVAVRPSDPMPFIYMLCVLMDAYWTWAGRNHQDEAD